MGKSNSLSRGGVNIGAATAVASAANYATNLALGRWLRADVFADAAIIISSLMILSAMAVGVQMTAARAVALGRLHRDLRLLRRRTAIGATILGMLFLAGSPWLAHTFHSSAPLSFAALGVGLPIYLDMAVRRGVLQGREAFGRFALTLVVEAFARLVATLIFVSHGFGASAAGLGLLLSFAAAWAVSKDPIPATERTERMSESSESSIRSATVPMALLLFGSVVIGNGDVLIVAAKLPTYSGVYAAISMIGRIVYVVGIAVVTVVFPTLSASQNQHRLNTVLARGVLATAIAGGSLTVLSALFADSALSLLGAGYAAGAAILWPYVLASTLFAVLNVFASAEMAVGRSFVPAMVAVAGIAQTVTLILFATRGLTWTVWVQVAVMAYCLGIVMVRQTRTVWIRSRLTHGVSPLPVWR